MDVDLFKVYEFKNKIRLGQKYGDGGYIIGELNEPYDCYISCGVSSEESFSRDFIKKYNMNKSNSYAFDGTIENYPYEYTRDITFYKKNINSYNDDNNSNLSFLLTKYNNIFIKMDIEGWEFPWIQSIHENDLKKIKQMTLEFHGITNDEWNTSLMDKMNCFKKINKTHYLIHAHGNNYGKTTNNIPDVIELTYVNKNYFEISPKLNTTALPLNIDTSNILGGQDYNLNFYPFVSKEGFSINNDLWRYIFCLLCFFLILFFNNKNSLYVAILTMITLIKF